MWATPAFREAFPLISRTAAGTASPVPGTWGAPPGPSAVQIQQGEMLATLVCTSGGGSAQRGSPPPSCPIHSQVRGPATQGRALSSYRSAGKGAHTRWKPNRSPANTKTYNTHCVQAVPLLSGKPGSVGKVQTVFYLCNVCGTKISDQIRNTPATLLPSCTCHPGNQ